MSKSTQVFGTLHKRPLSIICIPGWQLNSDNNYLAFADTWQSKLDQLQGVNGQNTSFPDVGVFTTDIASKPEMEPKTVIQELDCLINSYIETGLNIGLMGHSIGGYYAAFIAAKYHLPMVLINPLVKAYSSLLLADMLEGKPDFMDHVQIQLKEFETSCDPNSIMLMLQRGDLFQDYQEALELYAGSNQIILNGGHHNFHNLENWLMAITSFFDGYYKH